MPMCFPWKVSYSAKPVSGMGLASREKSTTVSPTTLPGGSSSLVSLSKVIEDDGDEDEVYLGFGLK